MTIRPLSFVFSFIAASTLLLIGCEPSSPPPPAEEVIVLKGDPQVFIQNTKKDTSSGIPLDFIQHSTKKWILNSKIFIQIPQISSADFLKTQQPPESALTPKSIKTYSLKKSIENPNLYSLTTDEAFGFDFQFENKKGSLILKAVQFEKGDIFENFRLEHYSVKPSPEAFSILVSGKYLSRKVLWNFVFSPFQNTSPFRQSLNAAYNYLYGAGVGVKNPQNQDLNMLVCSSNFPTLEKWVSQGVMEWQPHLVNRLGIKVTPTATCPPFSDLNSVTIQNIEGWVEVEELDAGVAAFVISSPDPYKNTILDSDMFFLLDEMKGFFEASGSEINLDDSFLARNRENLQEKLINTSTHEAGHLLGLHHVFDKNIVSIMSYNPERMLSDHDVSAIQELYPLRSKLD